MLDESARKLEIIDYFSEIDENLNISYNEQGMSPNVGNQYN